MNLKNCLLVNNICVYGDSMHDYVVALILPNNDELKKLAIKYLNQNRCTADENCNIDAVIEIGNNKLEQLCDDPLFMNLIIYTIGQYCQSETKLSKWEIPKRLYLCKEEWSPDNGLLTATAKLKRFYIYKFYEQQIKKMYL